MVNWPFVWSATKAGVEDGTFDQALLDDIGWALYPQVTADQPTAPPYGGINLGIGAFSNYVDLSYEAAECIVTPEHQAQYFATNGNPPSNTEAYDDPAVTEAFPMADVIRESLELAVPRPQTPYYNEVSTGLQQTWHPPSAVTPEVTPAESTRPDHRRASRGAAAMTTVADKRPDLRDAAAKAGRSDRAKSEARLGWLLAGPAFVVMLAVTLYPILQAFYDSLFHFRLTAPDDKRWAGLSNYAVVLTDPLFWQALGVTVFITVVTVVVELLLGFALALVMHRAIKQLRGLLRTAILVPYGIITVVSAFAWFYAFDINSGYINHWFAWVPGISTDLNWFAQQGTSLFVIIMSEIWKTTPFISLLLLAGLSQVPTELEEAAEVDGATWWQRLTRVVLPNMKAAIMVAVLFRALDAFRIFDNVFIMTNGANGTEVLSLLAYRTSIGRLEIGLGSAISVLLFLCVILHLLGRGQAVQGRSGRRREGGGLMKQLSTRAKWAWALITIFVISYALLPDRLDLRDVVQAAEPAQPRAVLAEDLDDA